jgi:hypothetical protein
VTVDPKLCHIPSRPLPRAFEGLSKLVLCHSCGKKRVKDLPPHHCRACITLLAASPSTLFPESSKPMSAKSRRFQVDEAGSSVVPAAEIRAIESGNDLAESVPSVPPPAHEAVSERRLKAPKGSGIIQNVALPTVCVRQAEAMIPKLADRFFEQTGIRAQLKVAQVFELALKDFTKSLA